MCETLTLAASIRVSRESIVLLFRDTFHSEFSTPRVKLDVHSTAKPAEFALEIDPCNWTLRCERLSENVFDLTVAFDGVFARDSFPSPEMGTRL